MSDGAERLERYQEHARACSCCESLSPRCKHGHELFNAWRLAPGHSVMPMRELEPVEQTVARAEARSLSELPAITLELKRIADALEARAAAPVPPAPGDFCVHQFEVQADGALECVLCKATRMRGRVLKGTPVNLLNVESALLPSLATRKFKAMLLKQMRLFALSCAASDTVRVDVVQLGEGARAVDYPVVLTAGPIPFMWQFPPATRQISENVCVVLTSLSGGPVTVRELSFWGDEL